MAHVPSRIWWNKKPNQVWTNMLNSRRQKVVIDQLYPGEWWVMHHTGDIEVYLDPEKALRAVQKQAKRGNKDITVTTIEWRNVPDGFVPPKGDA